jgi:orotidine-5'-phosphate decarboxylase
MEDERYTFSSLLNKMMEVERVLHDIIMPLVKQSDTKISKQLLIYLDSTERRVSDIQWVKDFVVVEMTLEPITGLEIDGILGDIRRIAEDNNIPLDRKLTDIISIVARLYEDVAEKLRYISIEASDVFTQFRADLLSILHRT